MTTGTIRFTSASGRASDERKRARRTPVPPRTPRPLRRKTTARAPAQKQRRLLRLAAWSVAGAFGFLVAAGGGGLLFLHSSAGEAWLTRTINGALQSLPGGLSASINGVQGPLPFRFQASGIRVCDEQGVWLEAESAELSMNWSELPKTLCRGGNLAQRPQNAAPAGNHAHRRGRCTADSAFGAADAGKGPGALSRLAGLASRLSSTASEHPPRRTQRGRVRSRRAGFARSCGAYRQRRAFRPL